MIMIIQEEKKVREREREENVIKLLEGETQNIRREREQKNQRQLLCKCFVIFF